MTADNDLQKALSAFGGEMLHAKIIDGQQIRFEKTIQGALGFQGRSVGLQIAHQIEHRAVENDKAGFDGAIADGLSQTTFPHTRRTQQ